MREELFAFVFAFVVGDFGKKILRRRCGYEVAPGEGGGVDRCRC